MEKNFDAASAEAAISKRWQDGKYFAAGANASREETFTIMIPPPNVTGSLHVGHAFNNTLQDILVRWHRMRGFDTLWQPGQDHAGIATQLVVERQLAKDGNETRREMGREKFLEKVMDWKEDSGGTIIEQLKRLGASCDWDRNAFTMDKNFHDAVLKVFVEMYNKGLIYRGKRLVNWDPHFETAISDLEVENIEVDGHMWHFKYPLAGGATYEYVEKDEDGNVTLRETRDYISIATTRPETMLGDGAVAVHPSDERYAPLVGKLCEIPVGPKQHRRLIPIITDDYPDPDFGSGAVKITGAHDANDYGVAKRGNIPLYRLMDTKAHMREDGAPYADEATKAQAIAKGADFTGAEVDAINLVPDEYRGLDRFEARKRVIADITAEGLAVMVAQTSKDEDGNEVVTQIPYVENKKIMQPFCDRSKVVMEPMLTDQWFVDTAKIVGPALDAVRDGRTKIIPDSGEKVYFHWLENIEPWCISRQLWWGHRIPVWYGPETIGKPQGLVDVLGNSKKFSAANEDEIRAQATEFYSKQTDKNILVEFENLDKLRERLIGRDAGGDEREAAIPMWNIDGEDVIVTIYQEEDVLDTWFSSGLWPIGTLGWPNETEELKKYFPTDVLITGQDILFFWVARMMMMQLSVVDQVPFHTVYLHQLVRDEKGKKMSKTTGNVIDPLEIIDEFGADALRFTAAQMASIGGVLKLSIDRIKGYRNFGTKIWNAVRFAEMNGCYESRPECTTNALPLHYPTQTANKWIIGETARALAVTDAALEAYRFNDAANGLYAHVWGKVCDWYVEFAKPLLQSDDEAIVAETRATMAWTLDQCLILMHPIMPFITEELWDNTATRSKMLVHADWPTYTVAQKADSDADEEMGWVINLIDSIRSLRAEMHVPAGAKIPLIELELNDKAKGALERNQTLVARIARVSEFVQAESAPKGAVTLPVEGGTFCLPLADLIDIASEKARLQKSLDKLAKEMGGLKGKLSNQKFIAKAPEEVVAENRARLVAAGDESAKVEAAIARLTALGE